MSYESFTTRFPSSACPVVPLVIVVRMVGEVVPPPPPPPGEVAIETEYELIALL